MSKRNDGSYINRKDRSGGADEDTYQLRARVPTAGGNPDAYAYKMHSYTRNAGWFMCSVCGGTEFKVLTAIEGALIQLLCTKNRCTGMTKVFEVRKPEMTEGIAKSLGLWLPSMSPAVDQDVELD